VSRPAKLAAKAFGAVSMAVPSLAPFLTPAAAVAGAVGSVAELLGMGRPAQKEAAMVMATAPNLDLSMSVGRDPVPVLGGDPAAESSPFAGVGGFASEDEMSAKFLGERWSLIAGGWSGIDEWSTGDAVNTCLMTIPISPVTIDGGKGGSALYTLQPIALLAVNHQYWRGEAVVKVKIFAGSMDSGRLRVAFRTTSGDASLDDLQLYSCLLDIGAGTTECEFPVKWCVDGRMLPVPPSYATMPGTSYSNTFGGQGYVLGFVQVFVDSPLVTNQASSTLGVKAFIKWPSFECSTPHLRLRHTIQCTSGQDADATSAQGVASFGDARESAYVAGAVVAHLRQMLV